MHLRHLGRLILRWLVCVSVAALVCFPIVAESAIERVHFEDRVGTLPVDIELAHNGHVTLDTGLLGKIYWRHDGFAGFGATLRSTGPPLAQGTLASYVAPSFVRANTSFLDDPDRVAAVYAEELRDQVIERTVTQTLASAIAVGTFLATGWSLLLSRSRRVRALIATLVIVAGAIGSSLVALERFRSWDGSETIANTHPLPGSPKLSFSSPQTREIAEQIQPFLEKNIARIKERTDTYERTAFASFREQLSQRRFALGPREGEVIVIAEADPQGAFVGTRVRRDLYSALQGVLPEGALVLRTIAGDVTSNGTVAESAFVDEEVDVAPGIPIVAAKGDHDTEVTVEQLLDAGVSVPDTEIVSAGGLQVASARDPAFKALFGGLVFNDNGMTEQDIGRALRDKVDDLLEAPGVDSAGSPTEAVSVVLHQPRAVEGYLGVDRETIGEARRTLTTPVDDGIPDVPAGVVSSGHLHDPDGPWVLWNTDGESAVTWTVVTQLGTAGGVEEHPTFNRFSTPFSSPLKTLSLELQYMNAQSGLATGLVEISIAVDGQVSIGDRVDVGLPGGVPGQRARPL